MINEWYFIFMGDENVCITEDDSREVDEGAIANCTNNKKDESL